MSYYACQYARGHNGKWFKFALPPRRFDDLDKAIAWASERLNKLYGHRIDLRRNRKVVAEVYCLGEVRRFS